MLDFKRTCIEFFGQTWSSPSDRGERGAYDIFSQNALISSPLGYQSGPHFLKNVMGAWFLGFPDAFASIENIYTYDMAVIFDWKAKGTHSGVFEGINPTGKEIVYKGETVFLFNSEGMIVHYISKLDMRDIFSPLGVDTPSVKPEKELMDNNCAFLIDSIKQYYSLLSYRIIEVLSLFIAGFSSAQVGLMLSLSQRTVEKYLEKAKFSFGCHKRSQMIERLLADATYFLMQDLARLLLIKKRNLLIRAKETKTCSLTIK